MDVVCILRQARRAENVAPHPLISTETLVSLASPKGLIRLLVPALNEAENLPFLLDELAPVMNTLKRPWSLLVVDDGSTDDTVPLLKRLGAHHPIEVVSHDTNKGPGAAFLTGFLHLLSDCGPQDPIITLEADTTSDVTILPLMLDHFNAGADVVLASVYHPQGGLKHAPVHRRALSLGANLLMQNAFDARGIHTFSSFYRVYRAGVLTEAFEQYGRQMMAEPGFASVVELLIKLQRMGARVSEVPMVLDSQKRRGVSRMKVLRTMRAYLRLIARLNLEPPPSRCL